MGATQGQLFKQPVWDPRPARWHLGCLLLDHPGNLWAALCLGLGAAPFGQQRERVSCCVCEPTDSFQKLGLGKGRPRRCQRIQSVGECEVLVKQIFRNLGANLSSF